jgi:predicted small lipoprotein YifL
MKTPFKMIAVIVLFTLVLTACGGKPAPTPTPEPPTPEPPTAEPVVEEEQPQVDPMIACAANIELPGEQAYPLMYCEDFENPDETLMAVGEYDSKYLDMKSDLYNGLYTIRMEVKRGADAWSVLPVHNARDFVIQVDGRLASHSGHPYHKWGIMLKKDPEDDLYYYFAIDNNSLYYFMMVRGEKLTNLINGRKSEEINPLDEFNTLTVVADGDTYSLYINGKFQEDFKDNRIQSGDLGLYFKVSENTILDWEFDNLVVYAN